ncbi:MAG: hypothetical protein HY235_25090 [Acidobacteria bacterium]|nr:hypothetical protein [Acidobacteriota bacterium]
MKLLVVAVLIAVAVVLLAPKRTAHTSIALPPDDTATFRVTLGLGDKAATDWSGTLDVSNHSYADVEGYRFLRNDRMGGSWEGAQWRFAIRSEPTVPRTYQTQLLPTDPPSSPKGLVVRVRGAAGRLRLETAQGGFAFGATEVPFGGPKEFLDGRARVERIPESVLLSQRSRQDDYPSVAVGPDGTIWTAWMSYHDQRDGILLARMRDKEWRGPVELPETSGDVWMPQVAVDAKGLVWVVWSQKADGNFDLYARPFHNDRWGAVLRLTDNPLPDINPHLVRAASGTLYVVWQGWRGRHSNILLKAYRDGEWQPEVRVTETQANDWFPQAAPCPGGRLWVVWDSYRGGNYDVFARSVGVRGDRSEEQTVAHSPLYEGDASAACAADGSLWVAYNTSGPNWGKDQGYLIRQRPVGIPMGVARDVRVRVYRDGRWLEPRAKPEEAFPKNERVFHFIPRMAADTAGRVWLGLRHRMQKPPTAGADTHPGAYFENYVTCFDGAKWRDAIPLPHSWDRMSARYSLAPSSSGELWAAWSTDHREFRSPNEPVWNGVYAARIPAACEPFGEPQLQPVSEPAPEVRPGHKDESGDVAALRAYRASVNGRQLQILRGDMHRHTELSVDVGAPDGSVLDFFRYMLDAAAMDFSGPTDHQGGGSYDYWWWLTQKLDDLFHVPGAYVPLFGYERSLAYPFGHKNVFHTYRGVRVVPFFYKYEVRPWVKDAPGNDREGVEGRSVVENETGLLYEQLRKSKGIAMAHTPATYMGTDWHTWDQQVEPAVEIYQGARTVYEEPEGPGVARKGVDDPHMRTQGYESAGFVWNALKKGYRLGFQASSDHTSTHISYSLVYVENPSREGIIDAIRKRHLYGATDNILLDVRMGRAFMGDEIAAAAVPPLEAKVHGTAPVAKAVVVRDSQYVYTATPNQQDATIRFQDRDAGRGTHYYYVRIEQADGQLAWSSPIWINVQ